MPMFFKSASNDVPVDTLAFFFVFKNLRKSSVSVIRLSGTELSSCSNYSLTVINLPEIITLSTYYNSTFDRNI